MAIPAQQVISSLREEIRVTPFPKQLIKTIKKILFLKEIGFLSYP